MLQLKKIGIIGFGYVGQAIAGAYADTDIELVIIDPALQPHSPDNEYANLSTAACVFVCVPSPSLPDGSADCSILQSVLLKLAKHNYSGIIISKVTAPPREYDALQHNHPNLIHVPEFLTAANAVADYKNSKFAIIGGNNLHLLQQVQTIISIGQPHISQITYCSISQAAWTKYAINSFLATKVIFMNELQQLLPGSDWSAVVSAMQCDPRVGNSHMQVPGPDGLAGFGGACFPKDTQALLKIAEQQSVSLSVLDAAVQKNMQIRPK